MHSAVAWLAPLHTLSKRARLLWWLVYLRGVLGGNSHGSLNSLCRPLGPQPPITPLPGVPGPVKSPPSVPSSSASPS